MLFKLLLISFSVQQMITECSTTRPGITLAMYYQPWCPFCQKYEPVMIKMANNAAIKGVPITVQKIDCSKCDCDTPNIKGYPTTVLYENGVELGRASGAMDCTTVSSFLNKNMCEKNGQLMSKDGSPIPVTVQPAPVLVQPEPIVVKAPTQGINQATPSSCLINAEIANGAAQQATCN